MHPKIGIGVLVEKNGKLLLQQRLNGEYAFPGGHLEFGEQLQEGAKRELKEETGIDAEVEVIGWTEEVQEDTHYIVFFVLVQTSQEPQHLEPEKGTSFQWYAPEDIPTPRFYTVDRGLAQYLQKLKREE